MGKAYKVKVVLPELPFYLWIDRDEHITSYEYYRKLVEKYGYIVIRYFHSRFKEAFTPIRYIDIIMLDQQFVKQHIKTVYRGVRAPFEECLIEKGYTIDCLPYMTDDIYLVEVGELVKDVRKPITFYDINGVKQSCNGVEVILQRIWARFDFKYEVRPEGMFPVVERALRNKFETPIVLCFETS
jgi:hypothetical protein